ncbi:MAG: hypothetical protein JXB23_02600 [Candidatus Aminicenantes bacterium]|nr:hypothetical protein [Candidatus Aminicenantes bacterium]
MIHGLPIMAKYHKLAMITLMCDSLSGLEKENIPPNIRDLYLEWFRRVLKDVSLQPAEYYDAGEFPFRQDLAVCSLRAIPVGGAWLVEVSRVIERRVHPGFINGSRTQVNGSRTQVTLKKIYIKYRILNLMSAAANFLKLRRIIYPVLVQLGVIQSFYQLHTFSRYMPRFSPEEMDNAYLRIAELLRRNKKIKGLFRRSWFLDPQLEHISPDLAYLRKIPEENGAVVFRAVTYPSAIHNALAMSSKRRKLYLAKEYFPQAYAYIWPREKLLKWAERRKDFLEDQKI